MRVAEYCTRQVVVAEGSVGVAGAARLMREHHVGDLVLVERGEGGDRPLGIVTDRDLVVEVLAPDADPNSITLADLGTRVLIVAGMDDDLMATLERMRSLGVRRVPVVDGHGVLQGILTADDVLVAVGELACNLIALVGREIDQEVRTRP